MTLQFKPIHPIFAAEADEIDLRNVFDETMLKDIRKALDHYAVIVFRDQTMSNDEHLEFTQRLDSKLHTQTSLSVMTKNRFGNEALSDVANVDENGQLMAADDRRRMGNVGNRLWHTDASFVDPPGRYSLLLGKVIPPVRADTEFVDMRAAYDSLDSVVRESLEGLQVHHSIIHSRQLLGFEFSQTEKDRLKGAVHPLVRTVASSGRRSLYLASHASHIIDWQLPEGRLLLRDLIEHATREQFIYRHIWQPNDLVIWDNRATMHRARPFADMTYRRELRRTTTLDIALTA
ncbi:MAG: TauD/TfdA dioxygenase family protein [Burkholderiaceae bacterium]|jgi:alpha-ketoglutarate-dependent 2,4-dichlorophenoxyacetate dioxygenase